MSGAATITCPKCGAQMNRHAEKLVYPESAVEARRMDSELGGLIQETFGCPNCGNVETRGQ
jgi:predicted RNA-binding Zn-ribbon protein involved in translation (DUF1610 family)